MLGFVSWSVSVSWERCDVLGTGQQKGTLCEVPSLLDTGDLADHDTERLSTKNQSRNHSATGADTYSTRVYNMGPQEEFERCLCHLPAP